MQGTSKRAQNKASARVFTLMQRPTVRLMIMSTISIIGLSAATVIAQSPSSINTDNTSGEGGSSKTVIDSPNQNLEVKVNAQSTTEVAPSDDASATITVNGQSVAAPAPNTTVNKTIDNGNGSVTNVTVSNTSHSSGSDRTRSDQSTRVRMRTSSGDTTNSYNSSTRISTDSE